MSTGTKQNFDEKVQEDFLFYLEHFKEAFDGLKSEIDKEICKKWLDKLAVETYRETNDKQARNIYLSQLILSMLDRKLIYPFNVPPTSESLSLEGVFKHITAKPNVEVEKEIEVKENKMKWSQFVRNRELEMVDLNHMSNDGRTYVACKALPENSGIFAYVAVTMGGNNNCGWVNTCGQTIPAPVVKPLDLKVESSNAKMNNSEADDQMYRLTVEVRTILSKRKSPEERVLTYEFYKKIYSSIEQEMLSEQDPNSTACRDPYVEKLLEKLINDSKGCETFNPHLFKRIKLLSVLKKRVKTILKDIEERNNNLSEIEIASTSPMMSLTKLGPNGYSSLSEMMWQEALMEKPTSKMAEAISKTYPDCLVKMLLALLARERRKIINRLQEKQEKLVLAMKRDLQNEIKQGILDYKIARKEWVDVMRIVLHYERIKKMLTEKSIGGTSDNTKGDYLQETIRKEIEDTRKRLDKTTRNNEKLQDDICDLNRNLHEVTEKIELEKAENADQLNDLRTEICNEKSKIQERTQTVEQLERMLQEGEK